MAVKFPLKISDASVRTMEELREHFELRAVLDYYSSGRLAEWLEDRFYDEEAEQVRDLDASSESFKEDLCRILGVPYLERVDAEINLRDIACKNKRRERLKKYTIDDKILGSVESVAFTQKELKNLLKKIDLLDVDDDDNRVIYLCGEHFTIPGNIGGIVYKGINNPTVEFDNNVIEAEIYFQDLEFDIKDNNDFDVFSDTFYKSFDNNPILGVKLLRMASERGSAKAQTLLGECYRNGFGVKKDAKEANKWLRKAAERGVADAQYRVGMWYFENDDEQEEWLRKAAEQGHADAQYELADWCEDEEQEAWLKKAAEQGHVDAIYVLADWYECKNNVEEAEKWYQKAFQLGDKRAGDDLKRLKEEFDEAEALNEHLGDAACAFNEAHQKIMGWLFGVEPKPKKKSSDNIVPFAEKEK